MSGANRVFIGVLGIMLIGLWLVGCNRKEPTRADSPRPIVAVELKASRPDQSLRLTGVVQSWSEEQIAFEVSGRVDFIVEAGDELVGRWVEGDDVIRPGDKLASIDSSGYVAAHLAAKADHEYARVTLESVLPASLAKAKAEETRARVDFEAKDGFRKAGTLSETEWQTAKASYESAKAQVEQVLAEIEAAKASLAKAAAALTTAELDLAHTTLYAPLTGEVASVLAQAGAFVSAGEPVAHLVMMDPVKVRVMVSHETNEQISLDDPIRVYVPGRAEPLFGKVYQKATVADPQTRTFAITLICRNRKTTVPVQADPAALALPRIDRVMPVVVEGAGEDGPLFVDEQRALRRDAQGYFVWRAVGVSVESGIDVTNPVLKLQQVRVELGEQRRNFQRLYILREVKAVRGLQPDQMLALGVPDGVEDGDRVALIRDRWLILPGSLVEIGFKRDELPQGFYVPSESIVPSDEGAGTVFVLDGEGDKAKAKAVSVTLRESKGDLVRVDSDQLKVGSKLIVEGVNYVRDGERVSVTRMLESAP